MVTNISKVQDQMQAGRVMVVEDDFAVRAMISEVLGERGFCAAGAASPRQAQGIFEEFKPHVVIIGSDGHGTFEHGWQLVATFRQQMPGIPLIMISTSDTAVAEVGVTDRGRLFDAALLKPFRICELVAQIEQHLP
jgi:DNA-binding response OmpR family regulator